MSTINTVAVVDDDELQAETVAELLRDAGLEPLILPSPRRSLASVDELLADILPRASAVVCDHRLSPKQLAQFRGSEVVARLYDERIPSLLLTQFAEMDSDVSIRRWRHKIPVVLARDDADAPSVILESLQLCDQEIEGVVAPFRRAHRSLVRIAESRTEDGTEVLDVFVLQWRPHTAVRLPAECIPAALRVDIVAHPILIAQVNLEARDATELFFRDFEPSPGSGS